MITIGIHLFFLVHCDLFYALKKKCIWSFFCIFFSLVIKQFFLIMSEKPVCASIECKNEAHLQCPTCVKLGKNENSFFCSQDCFKKTWVNNHSKKSNEHRSNLTVLFFFNRVLTRLFMETPNVSKKKLTFHSFFSYWLCYFSSLWTFQNFQVCRSS